MVEIPGFKAVDIEHIVCDYNGTVALDGKLIPKARELLIGLSSAYRVHIVTADTFGSVEKEIGELDLTLKILKSNDHTEEKAAYIESIGADRCVAIGNGNNDKMMLRAAAIGVAVIGNEGCAADALSSADIVCNDIADALTLFKSTRRLVATLRR